MPFVQKQLVPVQLSGGVNTKTDPKQLQAGQLLELKNGVFTKHGAINKRFGYDILSRDIEGGGTITNGVALTTYQDELVLFDGTSVYSYLAATGSWANRGTAISVITEDTSVLRTSRAQQINPDMNYARGVEIYAWEDSRGGVRCSVIDTANEAVIVSDVSLNSSASQPKVISFSGMLYLFYVLGNALYYKIVGPLNPSVIQPAVAVALDGYVGVNAFPYDVTTFTDSTGQPRMVVAYWRNDNVVNVVQFDANNVVTSVSAALTFTANASQHGAVNVVGDSTSALWVSWANGTDVRTSQLSFSGGAYANSPTYLVEAVNAPVIAAIEDYVTGTLRLFYEVTAALSYNEQTHVTTLTAHGAAPITAGTITTIRSVGLAGKPWNYNGQIFVPTAYSSTLQATDFIFFIPTLASGSAPIVVAKMTASVGGGLQSNGMCPEISPISTGVYKLANSLAGKLTSEANTLFSLLGVNSTQITHSPSDNFRNTTQANTLLIVGGVLQGYDGVSVTELGFHVYPENVTVVAAGGGNLSAGTYQYIVQFEWTDNHGQIYRSSPSVAVSLVATAGQSATVTGPSLRLTGKPKVSVVVYRTAVNGTLFRRVTSTLAPLLNDPTVDTWTFSDTLSDASAAANELNYTSGGVLANIAPPASSFITTYNNRVVLGGLSDKLLLWYSQAVVDNSGGNTVPPQFCAELTIACDPRGGDITAFGVLNQSLILFKASEIFSVTGNGPDATGNNNDFGSPTLVSSEVGCVDPDSVVTTSQGLLFMSQRGIYLLDVSLNLTYIGAPVEDFNSLTVTAAVENCQDSQIVFANSKGTAIVYDHYFHQWSTWTNHYAADMGIWQNQICFVTTDGHVWLQNRAKFTDGPSPIYLSLTLPNLSFAGIQGYQRVFRAFILGSYKGPHSLIVSVAYDFAVGYSQQATITPVNVQETWGSDVAWGAGRGWGLADVWGGNDTLYQYRIDLKTQKCTSLRLQIAETQSLNYNEGLSLSGVAFEVGALPGANRVPATRTFGSQ